MPIETDEKPRPIIKSLSNGFAWPDTDDIRDLAAHATPLLFKKAVELALLSNDPRLVRDVAVIASDRAHGKPHQSLAVSGNTTINIISAIPAPPNSIKTIDSQGNRLD